MRSHILSAIAQEKHNFKENHWKDSPRNHQLRPEGQHVNRIKHRPELQIGEKRHEERAFKDSNSQNRPGLDKADLERLFE